MAQSALAIRLDSDLKMQFDSLCEEFGISTNTAFNIYVRQWSEAVVFHSPLKLLLRMT